MPPHARPLRTWLWLLPGLAVLAAVFAAPLMLLVGTSLHPHEGMGQVGEAWTLRNYSVLAADGFYWRLLFDTLVLATVVTGISLVFSFPVAYVLCRAPSAWRGVLTFIVIGPLMISAVVRNLGWFPILGDSGVLNWLLLGSGLVDQPVKLMHNFTGVVIGLVHALTPFMVLSLTTVLQKVSRDLEEVALSLGARPWQMVWLVLVPLSRPGLLAGGALVFTAALSAFMTPSMMGGRRVQVMATYVEQQYRALLNYPAGSAVAVLLLVLALLFTALTLRADRRGTP